MRRVRKKNKKKKKHLPSQSSQTSLTCHIFGISLPLLPGDLAMPPFLSVTLYYIINSRTRAGPPASDYYIAASASKEAPTRVMTCKAFVDDDMAVDSVGRRC